MRKIKRLLCLFLSLALLITVFGGCASMNNQNIEAFKNEYVIPENTLEYTKIDTEPKEDWTAQWIWDHSDSGEENVWMCFRKTVDIESAPDELIANISADSRYWLYINGEMSVFEGSAKRGPSDSDGYYDSVDIAPYLHNGENIICALVWYWGKDTSYSNTDSGKAGFILEALGDGISIVTDSSWRVCRNTAYKNDDGKQQPNYRLPESNIYYDATREIGDWLGADFDDSGWESATEYGIGGCTPWGRLYPRGIPMWKDYGLKDYENSANYQNYIIKGLKKKITVDIPYNAQCTPYLKVIAPAGKKIKITTENTKLGAVCDTYITKEGEQEFEALGWFNGEHITYEIPAGVTILELKYRETGYDTSFSGNFKCNNEKLNTLWQKSLRTLYVTMRDSFMDCPDRERSQWWGDVTNEMAMTMYGMDTNAYLLYQKGVFSMLNHINPDTNVLQTVVPINNDFFELPAQQLAGVCGFWTYYTYTGDVDFVASVYEAALNYLDLWDIGSDNLVKHRTGSWDWMDWGDNADTAAIENAWYYYALSCVRNMAELLGKQADAEMLSSKMNTLYVGYQSLWTEDGYKGAGVKKPDDRANAVAVLAGLANEEKFDTISSVLTDIKNSSPYMEYYVLTALCEMGRADLAQSRMRERYHEIIADDYSTLWEHWDRDEGTLNHAWSGGPMVVMSKYFAGVRPIKAGYDEFCIKPMLADLLNIDCTVPTVKGYIKVTEKRTDGGFELKATMPKDTTAVIYIPYNGGQSVKCNGELIYADGRFLGFDGVEFVEISEDYIVFSVDNFADRELTFESF